MSRKKVVITLTQAEAEALAYAAGNSLYSEEDAMALFGERKHQVNAAFRGYEKLQAATHGK